MLNLKRLCSVGSVGLTTMFGCCMQTPPQAPGPATKPMVAKNSAPNGSAPKNSAPKNSAPKNSVPARPFVLPEAALPAGFPAPGPVGVVLIKQYPPCREARVESGSGEDSMFMSLFNHIKTNQIPMTTPVEMTWDASPTTQPGAKMAAMAFVYGQASRGSVGTQGRVHVIDLPAQTVVSIGVRGGYNQNNLKSAVEKLNAYLAAHPGEYQVTGTPRYLGYNSPFVPFFLQYGEVQLPVADLKPALAQQH